MAHNTNTTEAIAGGWRLTGDADAWVLLAKASDPATGDYHSTKVLALADGSCLVQCDSVINGQVVRTTTWAPAPPA